MGRSKLKPYSVFKSLQVPNPQALGYTVGKTLGTGSFATVIEARLPHPRTEKVALKIVDKTSASKEALANLLPSEIQILRRINHPNIISLLNIVETETQCIFALELAEKGNLSDYIKQRRGKVLPEAEGRFLFKQICQGIHYCHAQDIVHRDIKCENMLLDRFMNIKIGDFGFALDLKSNSPLSPNGTFSYAAPELLYKSSSEWDLKKADMWSMGVTLYRMLMPNLPFGNNSFVQQGLANYNDLQLDPALSQECKSLIQSLLNVNIKSRLDIVGTMAHVWNHHQPSIRQPGQSSVPKDSKSQYNKGNFAAPTTAGVQAICNPFQSPDIFSNIRKAANIPSKAATTQNKAGQNLPHPQIQMKVNTKLALTNPDPTPPPKPKKTQQIPADSQAAWSPFHSPDIFSNIRKAANIPSKAATTQNKAGQNHLHPQIQMKVNTKLALTKTHPTPPPKPDSTSRQAAWSPFHSPDILGNVKRAVDLPSITSKIPNEVNHKSLHFESQMTSDKRAAILTKVRCRPLKPDMTRSPSPIPVTQAKWNPLCSPDLLNDVQRAVDSCKGWNPFDSHVAWECGTNNDSNHHCDSKPTVCSTHSQDTKPTGFSKCGTLKQSDSNSKTYKAWSPFDSPILWDGSH